VNWMFEDRFGINIIKGSNTGHCCITHKN
jgi:hypothetical protein